MPNNEAPKSIEDRVREVNDKFCNLRINNPATYFEEHHVKALTTLINDLLKEKDEEWGEWVKGDKWYSDFAVCSDKFVIITKGGLEARLASKGD